MKLEGYDTDITYNSDKPSMIPIRLLDVSKAKDKLGFETKISLKEGLEKTIKYFCCFFRSRIFIKSFCK